MIEKFFMAALAAAIIVVIVAWLALACVAPFALLKLCGMILLA